MRAVAREETVLGRVPLVDAPRVSDADGAVALVGSGDTVVLGSLSAEPRTLTAALCRRASLLRDVTIVTGTLLEGYPFLELPDTPFRMKTWFMPGTLLGVSEHRVAADFIPAGWVQTTGFLASLQADAALLQVSPADADGYHSLGVSTSQFHALAGSAKRLIAEVNPQMPRTCGDSLVHRSRFDVLVPADYPLRPFPHRPGDAVDDRIGDLIAGLVPDGSVLQFGIGSIPGAAVRALIRRGARGLTVVSQLTDAAMALIEAGCCVTGVAARVCEILGTRELYRWADRNPRVAMAAASQTHGLRALAAHERLVSVNSALEIDLYGQVNSECVDGHQAGGIGGSIDFAIGCQAPGALSIVAMRATTRDGRPRIVPRLSSPVVTIPRSLVQMVITENGVADLRGRTASERALALADLADASSRDALRDHARHL